MIGEIAMGRTLGLRTMISPSMSSTCGVEPAEFRHFVDPRGVQRRGLGSRASLRVAGGACQARAHHRCSNFNDHVRSSLSPAPARPPNCQGQSASPRRGAEVSKVGVVLESGDGCIEEGIVLAENRAMKREQKVDVAVRMRFRLAMKSTRFEPWCASMTRAAVAEDVIAGEEELPMRNESWPAVCPGVLQTSSDRSPIREHVPLVDRHIDLAAASGLLFWARSEKCR